MEEMLLTFATTNPHIGTLLMVVGGFRLASKPILLFLHSLAEESEWEALEQRLQQLEKSRVWRVLTFTTNWLASLPLESNQKRIEKIRKIRS